MHTSPHTMDIPDIRLPLQFIITGLFLFVAAQGMMLIGVEPLAEGKLQAPHVLASVHLFILGFGVMIAIGAMYQLIPVALQTNLHSIRLGHAQYAVYTAGIVGLWWSFFHFSAGKLVFFACITVIGIALFEYNMWVSMKGTKRTAISTAVKYALIYLWLTVIIGLWLTLDFLSPHLGDWHQRLLYVHILFGLIGWFTLLIIGVSYKLVAMFSLSHGHESRLESDAVRFMHYGVIILAGGFLTTWKPLVWVGGLGIGLGFILFGLQLRRILQKRMKKKLDLGLQVALFSWPYTVVLLLLVALISIMQTGNVAVPSLIYVIITGWIALTILGYLQKIVPFLWWTHRYSQVIGAKNVPTLKDMVHEPSSRWIFIFIIVAIAAVAFSLTLHLPFFLWGAQLVFFLVCAAYAVNVITILTK